MKKQVLFGLALICSAFMTDLMAADPSVDPAVYTPRGTNGEMTLKSKWLYSNKLNNYNQEKKTPARRRTPNLIKKKHLEIHY